MLIGLSDGTTTVDEQPDFDPVTAGQISAQLPTGLQALLAKKTFGLPNTLVFSLAAIALAGAGYYALAGERR